MGNVGGGGEGGGGEGGGGEGGDGEGAAARAVAMRAAVARWRQRQEHSAHLRTAAQRNAGFNAGQHG